ncbi:MAG: hypothetical protein J2P35_03030 [Actinobacteria bacterium]|nr:hypothetical protein [Actinomycetota bacterium]
MTAPDDLGASQRPLAQPEPPGLFAPAVVAGGLSVALGTAGYSMVGFGIATSCTDVREGPHGCDAMYRWMHAGVIGQWVLFLAVVMLVVAGRVRPGNRKGIAVGRRALAALAPAWFVFYEYGAVRSFHSL